MSAARYVKWQGRRCRLVVSKYPMGGQMAVVLSAAKGGDVEAVLSCNLPGTPPLLPDRFWLKSWSENEELARQLLDQGVIVLTGRKQATGYAYALEAKLA